MIDQDGNYIEDAPQKEEELYKLQIKKTSEELARLLKAKEWKILELKGKEKETGRGMRWKEVIFTYDVEFGDQFLPKKVKPNVG
tara:strand:- start:171 stop:422 length:252 start_codon:yes stop_codon:yes gene_type:complete